jgi:HEAT repeat protein
MLMQVIKSEGKSGFDTQSVNFALTSLGRIAGVPAGADGKGGCPVSVRQKAMGQLMDTFNGKSQTRPFAALALGLLGRDLPEPEKVQISETIRNTLAKSSGDVEARGALVISLGLLRDIQSAPLLQALLQDKGLDKKLRGTAAVSLGLIGERGALEAVRKTLKEKEDRELRVDAAIAAGLLKDNEAVPALVETLRDPKASQFILGSVATALGQIGDERALDPLTEILGDEQYPDLTRALAAVALGQIGDKTDVPVMSRVSKDVNYRAYYDAIGELLTII